MKIQTKLSYCLFMLLLSCGLFAQTEDETRTNSGNLLTFDVAMGAHLPGGDLKDRFGSNLDIGIGLEWMTKNDNWIIGLRGGYLFGSKVKEDVLASLRTPEGNIIAESAGWANVQLQERALYTNVEFGKLIGLLESNPRSGLRLTLGLGFLQHKIRLQDDRQAFVPQITGKYAKGYDRLTNGLALTEFVGYQHLSNSRLINFYFGFEFVQAFTQSRRDWDFVLKAKDETKRTDLLMGIKLGWILPFYMDTSSTDSIRY